jgi:hypothetical protein
MVLMSKKTVIRRITLTTKVVQNFQFLVQISNFQNGIGTYGYFQFPKFGMYMAVLI